MTKRRIVVPEGMKAAFWVGSNDASKNGVHAGLEAALRWLSDNPIVPTSEQLFDVSGNLGVKMAQIVWTDRDMALIAEWQRRMFLAPEPEVPREIRDFLPSPDDHLIWQEVNSLVLYAHRLGKESK